ncbi:hypothetical protein [Pseudonocardia sp.]|jgi:hypothetical protein|uniref:hypothetical protein n=1 Tax=Pseudonocardia sp. TaxID=60912 RepID=UPI002D8EA6CD|nr:hypothetical protein [Pseudonocardia sp.]
MLLIILMFAGSRAQGSRAGRDGPWRTPPLPGRRAEAGRVIGPLGYGAGEQRAPLAGVGVRHRVAAAQHHGQRTRVAPCVGARMVPRCTDISGRFGGSDAAMARWW